MALREEIIGYYKVSEEILPRPLSSVLTRQVHPETDLPNFLARLGPLEEDRGVTNYVLSHSLITNPDTGLMSFCGAEGRI